MWKCPNCHENIEDQFDSCWKCAGAKQTPAAKSDLPWMYPLFSVAAWIGLGSFVELFQHASHYGEGYIDLGGAILGIVVSSVCVWAFFSCPRGHWVAKSLTLLSLIGGLLVGVVTVGSYLFHILGRDAI
jgi:hypothetical protein